jgi:hypothetical protein
MKRREQPTVKFVPLVDGLETVEESRPRPAREFIPKWWKSVPVDAYPVEGSVFPTLPTVKVCPSFPDYFTQGYILPMWADTTLWHDEESGEWKWNCGTSNSGFEIFWHPKEQFLDHVSGSFFGNKATFTFKFITPWRALTAPGYSLLQLPMFFHQDDGFSVVPGVLETDVFSSLNLQVLYYGDKKEIFIPRGTPLVQYIPIKKEKLIFEVSAASREDKKLIRSQDLKIRTVFKNGYKLEKTNFNKRFKGKK